MKTSPRLTLAASKTRSEAEVRALAAAKVAANKAYEAIVYSPKTGLTDEQLVDREIALAKASRALYLASEALAGAV